MVDKSIIGTFITIVTILGTFTYNQGSTSNKIESLEKEAVSSEKSINSNSKDINQLKVDIAKIESKIDEGFKRLETLLIEN